MNCGDSLFCMYAARTEIEQQLTKLNKDPKLNSKAITTLKTEHREIEDRIIEVKLK